MMRWLCRLIGHTEGTQTIFPNGYFRCTNHKCWRCDEEVPTDLRSEYVTLNRVRWRS